MRTRSLLISSLTLAMLASGCIPSPAVQPITTPPPPSPTAAAATGPPISTPAPSATPTAGAATPAVRATPVSDSPAAGICDFYPGELIAFEIFPDIPSPRCARATPDQRLKVINRMDQDLDFWIGPYRYTVKPGEEQTVDAALGTYLAPGVHRVSTTAYGGEGGPELWLVTDP